jgi:hypothetical protein
LIAEFVQKIRQYKYLIGCFIRHMQKSNQKSVLIYALIISVLGGCLYRIDHQKKTWLSFAEQVLKSQKETQNEVSRINEHLLYTIEKQSRDYPCQQANNALLQAKATLRLCAVFLAYTEDIREQHWVGGYTGNPFSVKGLLDTQKEKEALIQRVALFQDSLLVMLQNDTALLNKLKPQFSLVDDLMYTHREDHKLLYLANLDIQMLIIAHDLLQFLVIKTGQIHAPTIYESFLPNVRLKQACVIRGQPFYGFVTLDSYSMMARNVSYYCNDKKLPIKDGLGRLRLKIADGDPKYTIKAVVNNPLTGATATLTKEFSISLCNDQ